MRGCLAIRSALCGLISAIGLVAGCPNAQTGGTDDKSAGEVAGFFRADEPWLIAWNFSVGGYGDKLDFALLVGEDQLPICFGRVTQGEVTYEQGRLHVTADFTDFETGRTCTLDIEAQAAQCARESGSEPPEYCDLTDVTGAIVVDGQEYPIDQANVGRKPRCDAVPDSLETGGFWNIINVHPIATGYFFSRSGVGALVEIGADQSGMTSDLFLGADGEVYTGCLRGSVEGPIEFDGDSLSLDVTINELEGGASCRVVFQGQRDYCATEGGGSLYVLRFQGEGHWSHDGESGPLDALFVTVSREDLTPEFVNLIEE